MERSGRGFRAPATPVLGDAYSLVRVCIAIRRQDRKRWRPARDCRLSVKLAGDHGAGQKLAVARSRVDPCRSCGVGRLPRARSAFKKFLAFMGDRFPSRVSDNSHRKGSSTRHCSDRLRGGRAAVGLSGDYRVGARDDAPSQAECRTLLTALLAAVDPPTSQAVAESLIDELGSLAAVLAAEPHRLRSIPGTEAVHVAYLETVRSAFRHSLRTRLLAGPVLSNTRVLRDYLFAKLSDVGSEQLRVLFLDAGNRLIRDEVIGRGSTKEVPVYPSLIMGRALGLNSTAIIIAHNHPSGDPEPSDSDIQMTRALIEAARVLDIAIHDHVIVARSGIASMRELGLL